jgi:PAS domain S-box-containing protein
LEKTETAKVREMRGRSHRPMRKRRNGSQPEARKSAAELLKANERLREEIEERARTEQTLRLEEARLDALLRLSRISEAPVSEIAAFILEQGIALTQSKIGFVGFLNEDESVYTLHAVSKNVVKECEVAGDPMQWHIGGAGLWADAIRERRSLFINDYNLPHPTKKGLPPGHPPVARFMVVPVFDGTRIVAVAGVGNKTSAYDKSDERQITLLLGGMWSHVQKSRSKAALQAAYDELERKVQQRTAELAAANKALQEDIIERERTEEALRHSEERFRRAIEEAPIPIVMHAEDGEVLQLNRTWTKLTGYTEDDIRTFDEWAIDKVIGEGTQEVRDFMRRLFSGSGGSRVEFAVRTKDGGVRHWSFSASSPGVLADGRRFVVGMALDITERKEAENVLRRDKEAFERLVQERTRDLAAAEVQLERAKRLSDIGTLAATVAHELRNPLAAISMAAYNVRAKAKMPALEKHLRNIEKKVSESEQIISNLLFYSKIKPPRFEAASLYDVIRQCAAASASIAKKEIPVKLRIRPLKGVLIEADSLQMTEVITNLLNNARDAISEPGGGIEIVGNEDGGNIRIVIRDSGCGIDKEDLQRIFDPFYTTKAKGTGLGLSVCQQIINLHNGEISIESEMGKGSTVTLRLPKKRPEAP